MKRNVLSLILFSSILFSCSGSNTSLKFKDVGEKENVRNYYEIFVRSFYDSNHDGIGDLNGVTAKLDYIKELGYNGIWLMPINKAYSYHKYDVIDYYDIDPEYGTLDDLDNLLSEAKKRDIKVILDLVVNHTSNKHPWFIESINSNLNNTSSKYKDYYNYSTTSKSKYTKYGSIYYESQFVSSMPDLNLDSDNVKNEIKNIIKFYLDRGVSGFRLDTVINYFTGNPEKNAEFIKFIVDYAKSLNPNCYIVAEAWTNNGEIERYYETGIDSCFAFGTGSEINASMIMSSWNTYYSLLNTVKKTAGNYIPAPFIGNHDVGRSAGILGRKIKRVKFGYGLLGMLNGNIFAYYGDEIGMIASGITVSDYLDKSYRVALPWDKDKKDGFCLNPEGVSNPEYIYPSVEEQLDDPNSILNYYKKVNYLRNNYSVISKGDIELVSSTKNSGIIKKRYKDEEIYIAINFLDEPTSIELDGEFEIINTLKSDEISKIDIIENKLNLCDYSIALLKRK